MGAQRRAVHVVIVSCAKFDSERPNFRNASSPHSRQAASMRLAADRSMPQRSSFGTKSAARCQPALSRAPLKGSWIYVKPRRNLRNRQAQRQCAAMARRKVASLSLSTRSGFVSKRQQTLGGRGRAQRAPGF